MFFEVVWIVGYAPLIVRTLNVMPIFAALAWITGTIALSTERVSEISSTFLHWAAVHLPVLPGSYFDSFISAAAFDTLPASPGVLYGSKPLIALFSSESGTMCVAIDPAVGPPHAFRSELLSMIRFMALRTWMSSNGGCVRLSVRYHVRS